MDDVAWIVGELEKFSEFYGTRHKLFNADVTPRVVEDVVRDHLMLVAEVGGRKAGFIAGTVTPHMFNPEIRVLSEVWWWVAEWARGTAAGAALLDRYLEVGKTAADWITMILEDGSPVNDRSMLKRGFRFIERCFLLEV